MATLPPHPTHLNRLPHTLPPLPPYLARVLESPSGVTAAPAPLHTHADYTVPWSAKHYPSPKPPEFETVMRPRGVPAPPPPATDPWNPGVRKAYPTAGDLTFPTDGNMPVALAPPGMPADVWDELNVADWPAILQRYVDMLIACPGKFAVGELLASMRRSCPSSTATPASVSTPNATSTTVANLRPSTTRLVRGSAPVIRGCYVRRDVRVPGGWMRRGVWKAEEPVLERKEERREWERERARERGSWIRRVVVGGQARMVKRVVRPGVGVLKERWETPCESREIDEGLKGEIRELFLRVQRICGMVMLNAGHRRDGVLEDVEVVEEGFVW